VRKTGQTVIGGLLLLVLAAYFFMPFSRWNGLASASLLAAHLFYLIKAFRFPAKRPKRVRVEMAVYAVLLMILLPVPASRGIPLFAWVFLGGNILNLWVRVFYPPPGKKEPGKGL